LDTHMAQDLAAVSRLALEPAEHAAIAAALYR
jgi:hypothetical protein